MDEQETVPEATKKICADILFTYSVQLMAQRLSITFDEARNRLINSPAYRAMYDYGTGLWQEGPVYFLNYYEQVVSLQRKRG
ncbi:MAG: hypothetical protein IJS15_07655 [Victivallales bacterium]|nr:hypothetical protein [Victivallales bacterium]